MDTTAVTGRLTDIFKNILIILSVYGVAKTLMVYGFLFPEPIFIKPVSIFIAAAITAVYILWIIAHIVKSGRRFRRHLPDIFLTALIISTILPLMTAGAVISIRIMLSLVSALIMKTGQSIFFTNIRLNPARLLLLSFLMVITIGTLFLMLPASTADRLGAPFLDALFTSTSATCVTGLIVQDTGSYFSFFGQIVILLLIQTGGLGIMTFSTLFAMILGRRLGLRHEEYMLGIMDQRSSVDMYRLIIQIIRITLIVELSGGILLFLKFLTTMDSGAAAFDALFHAVSAFCNAGFSLNADSLCRYAGDAYINLVFMALIVIGGLGFVVLNELVRNTQRGNPFTISWQRLSVHTKLILSVSAALLVIGTLSVFFFEFDNTMLDLSTSDRLLAAAFQSVTFRTAGFNTIDIGKFREVTLLIGVILMFIGASPASTGGGIKTTTLAVLILSVRSLLYSRDKVEVWHRTIPPQTVYKSIAILFFSLSFLILFTILLIETQEGEFLDILFETASAIGTVGLSTGVTNTLNGAGKVMLSILMYMGRVGPLTVALALGEVKKVNITYPTTDINVG